MSGRLLLVVPTTSYQVGDFLEAARRRGVEVVVGSERAQALESAVAGTTLTLDLDDPERAADRTSRFHERFGLRGVVAVDERTAVAAAAICRRLGLPYNSVDAARAAADKEVSRRLAAAAGVRVPRHEAVDLASDPSEAARRVGFPCVVKPTFLSGSRGVMRADDPAALAAACRRLRALLERAEISAQGGARAHRALIERYIDGDEVALEGLLSGGRLQVLALFDKPDPLVGPFFAETIYVTPSRHPVELQRAVVETTAAACRALGLETGPVHAELRIDGEGPWLLEVAARTIGGLCGRALRFGTGHSLEEIVVCHACGLEIPDCRRERCAAGVMMLPVPAAGVLVSVCGLDEAGAVAGIEGLTISVHIGDQLEPLPEGNRYMGFLLARRRTPAEVEEALRRAGERIEFVIDAGG